MKETTVQIDGAGRLVLPKPLREKFGLRGGDTLAIAASGDAIELRPAPAAGRLSRVNGVLVYTGPGPLPGAEDLVERSREERITELTRRSKAGR